MENQKFLKILVNLAQLDIDAESAYEQALTRINNKEYYEQLAKFRDDHLDHINDLSALIRKHGGQPPERTLDFKGYLIEGFTSLRSVTGLVGALKAMKLNEMLTNKIYKGALSTEDSKNWPEDVIGLIKKNYFDEVKHLAYIRDAIDVLEAQE